MRLFTILPKIQKYFFVLGFWLHPDLVYFQDTSCTTDVAYVHFFLNGRTSVTIFECACGYLVHFGRTLTKHEAVHK